MNDQNAAALSVAHATFTIERIYAAKPTRVFNAFADKATKRRWFVEGEGWEIFDYELDFRPGGREYSRFSYQGGPPMTLDVIYHEIVADRRMLFSYWMAFDGKVFSASTATNQFEPHAKGTKLIYTEQSTHLDGFDDGSKREHGSRELLEKLAKELAANP